MKKSIKNKFILFIVIVLAYIANNFLPLTLLAYYESITYRSPYNTSQYFLNDSPLSDKNREIFVATDIINDVNDWGREIIIIPFIFKLVISSGPYNDFFMLHGGVKESVEEIEFSLRSKGESIYRYRGILEDINKQLIPDISKYKNQEIEIVIEADVLNEEGNTDRYRVENILKVKVDKYFGPFWFYILGQL